MRIGETHPSFGQSIYMSSLNFGGGVVGGDIAITKVIGQYVDDIGFLLLSGLATANSQEGAQQKCA